jgi:putative transcriptional regulator
MSIGESNGKIQLRGGMAMEDVRSIISYRIDEYGSVKVKLAEVLNSRGITRNRLRTLTGVKYEVIDRYYQNHVERVDLDFIAKVCYVLNCKVEDLLEYSNPDG